jgi:hypothetical protein
MRLLGSSGPAPAPVTEVLDDAPAAVTCNTPLAGPAGFMPRASNVERNGRLWTLACRCRAQRERAQVFQPGVQEAIRRAQAGIARLVTLSSVHRLRFVSCPTVLQDLACRPRG